jgi:hypothetical protein
MFYFILKSEGPPKIQKAAAALFKANICQFSSASHETVPLSGLCKEMDLAFDDMRGQI